MEVQFCWRGNYISGNFPQRHAFYRSDFCSNLGHNLRLLGTLYHDHPRQTSTWIRLIDIAVRPATCVVHTCTHSAERVFFMIWYSEIQRQRSNDTWLSIALSSLPWVLFSRLLRTADHSLPLHRDYGRHRQLRPFDIWPSGCGVRRISEQFDPGIVSFPLPVNSKVHMSRLVIIIDYFFLFDPGGVSNLRRPGI